MNEVKIKIERLGDAVSPVTIRRGGQPVTIMSKVWNGEADEPMPPIGLSWAAADDFVVVDLSEHEAEAASLNRRLARCAALGVAEGVSAGINASDVEAWTDDGVFRITFNGVEFASSDDSPDEAIAKALNYACVALTTAALAERDEARDNLKAYVDAAEAPFKGYRHEIKRAKLEATRLGIPEGRIERLSDILDVFAGDLAKARARIAYLERERDAFRVGDRKERRGTWTTIRVDRLHELEAIERGVNSEGFGILARLRRYAEKLDLKITDRSTAVDIVRAMAERIEDDAVRIKQSGDRLAELVKMRDEARHEVESWRQKREESQCVAAKASNALSAERTRVLELEELARKTTKERDDARVWAKKIGEARDELRELLARERSRASAWRAKAEVLHLDRAKRTWDDIVAGIERGCGEAAAGAVSKVGHVPGGPVGGVELVKLTNTVAAECK